MIFGLYALHKLRCLNKQDVCFSAVEAALCQRVSAPVYQPVCHVPIPSIVDVVPRPPTSRHRPARENMSFVSPSCPSLTVFALSFKVVQTVVVYLAIPVLIWSRLKLSIFITAYVKANIRQYPAIHTKHNLDQGIF